MENSSPKLAKTKVPNTHLGFIKNFLLFFIVFFALINQSFAQGTTCSNATPINLNGICLSSTNANLIGNDSNPSFVNCQSNGNINNVRWYTFTVTGGPLNVTITAIGNRNLAFQLIGSTTNNCSNLSEIACVNDVGGQGSNNGTETTTQLLSNGTYFIKILNNANNTNLDLASLCVTGIAPEYTIPTSGNNSITTCSGNLYDSGGSSGNYVNNSDGYTVINPSIAGNRVQVSGTLTTEGGYDYMTIYDGAGTGGAILWGGSIHGNGISCTNITVPTTTSTTGPLTVRFYSDFSNTCSGFNLAISCIAPAIPTITSFTPSSGCPGSSLTITGTNLSNASAVTIGNTAATITANTATSITVTVGTGTTGTVKVTTPNGTATSATNYTVLPTPTITAQPTTPALVCASNGVRTISVTATNATTYQWRRNGVNLTNVAPFSGVTTNTLTITNPSLANNGDSYDVIVGNGSCPKTSNAVVLTVVTTPTITSNPANSTIAAGANTSFTVSASNNPTSYTWQVSTNGGSTWTTVTNGGVYSNATTATLNITNANGTMDGYRYRASATNSCGTSAFSNSALLTVTLNYCTPTTSTTTSGLYITKVAFIGTLNDPTPNTSTYATAAPLGYQNFTGLPNKAIQAQGEGININASATGNILQRGTWKAWVDWNKNGTFEPATEEVYNIQGFAGSDATFGFIIPPTTIPGDYRLRIRVNNGVDSYGIFGSSETFGYNFTPCDSFGSSGFFPVTSNYGEAEDYLFTVIANCNANITSVTNGQNCGSGSIVLNVTGTASATGYKWYANQNDSTPIATTTNPTWTTPSLTTTTNYWVTATSATCESVYKTKIIAKVNPTPTITFSPNNPIVCGDNNEISLTAGGDKEVVYLVNENFEGGNLGAFTNVNNDSNPATVKGITSWKNQTSTLVPDTNVWFPAISSGFGTNKFALAYSDAKNPNRPTNTIDNSITLTTGVNTTNFLNLTLKLKLFYSRYYADGYTAGEEEYVNIELSTNGGATYPIILQSFTSDVGIGTRFAELSYSLSPYINVTNLKIRVRHHSYAGTGWLPDGVAIDDVELFGEKPLNTAFTYNTSTVNAFTDAACTIPYTGTPETTIWIKPTALQLENPSFTIPVSTVLSNGCSASASIVVSNNTRTWQGGTADWSDPNNWRPNNVPTIDNCVVIPANTVISGTNYKAYGKNLTVKNNGNLNIQSSNSLTIADAVVVEPSGTFQLENSSSLIQINNVANTGNIIYKRNATVKKYDYVYWSSPVIDFNMNGIPASARYAWNPTAPNANGGEGNWYAASGNMATGTGYIFRVPNSTPTTSTPDNLTTTFNGVPFNGTKNITVSRGNDSTGNGTLGTPRTISDDNWNLIGNPYPSAIGVNEFLEANSAIEGFVYVWTHGNSPFSGNYQNPFYQNYTYNYNPNDYIQINKTGSTSGSGDYKIASGQGFFVLMNAGSVPGPASATVTFNNSMRSENFSNNMFYKNANTSNNLTQDNSRIWLDLNSSAGSSRILVGYIQGATNQKDRMFDAFTENKDDQNFYSIIDNANNEIFKIQGKALPFNDDDIVPLGVKIVANGNHSIAISEVDGLFLQNQDIYLKDELLNIYHDLKSAPYTFTATAGVHNDRFKLVYKSATVLSNQTFNENEIQIAKNNNIINIVSGNETMDNVKVFDIRGRLIVERTKINNNTISIDVNTVQDQVLILNITTTEGIKITRKIL